MAFVIESDRFKDIKNINDKFYIAHEEYKI